MAETVKFTEARVAALRAAANAGRVEYQDAELPALRLRVLELTARDKACEHPDKACHGESCPLAAGFHDRLPLARRSAADVRTEA